LRLRSPGGRLGGFPGRPILAAVVVVIAAATLPEIGTADHYQISRRHIPQPLRFVWHHIQPHEAGGATTAENLAQLCDSCHYSTHRLLWHLARGEPLGIVPRRAQLELARQGYAACQAAGTVDRIPNEG